jgi:hypothetical protein
MSSNEKERIICSELGETSLHIKKSYHKTLDFLMQNDEVWLIGLIQPGQTETVIGCLNEQAPMQLLYTLMRSPRSCEPSAAETADFHVSSEPGCGGAFARRELGPVADARNQTATRCILRTWFS